jgi:hypothetical protein
MPDCAVGDLEQQRAVAARRVDGLEHEQIRGEVDALVGRAWREIQVGNRQVARVRRIDGELDAAGETLVRAGAAERLAAGHDRSRRDPDSRDLGARGWRRREQEPECREQPAHQSTPAS